MARQFNASHISASRNTQVQMTNWYDIAIGDISDAITLMVRSCNLPEVSNPVVELPYGNSKAKVPGQAEFGDNTLSFMDAMVLDVEKQLRAWQSQVYDAQSGKMGWVDDYKKTMVITPYGPDGTCERPWKFEGAWPTSINYGEMTSESSDAKVIQVTIAYDNAYRL